MSATLPVIAPELLESLRNGDEHAYHRLVVDLFPALVAEATSQLDDPMNASRIVEGVLLELWDERARMGTSAAITGFLGEALRDGVVRDKRKRAALHRFESREGAGTRAAHGPATVTPEEAWQHIEAALHRPAVDAAALHREVAVRQAHEAAHHIADVAKPRSVAVPVIVGTVIAAFVLGGLAWLNREGADAKVTKALASADVREIKVARGQMGNTTLGDGTRAAIGAESRLRLVPRFGTEMRALAVEGTAGFAVAPNASLPFVVRAGNMTVTATGTAFAVRAFADEPEAGVRVTEGSVTVQVGDVKRTLSAPGALVVTRDGAIRDAVASDLAELFGWQEQTFTVTGVMLKDVLPQLHRWYGLDLKVPDPNLTERLITMSAPLASSKDAIAALERGGQLKFEWVGQTQTLRDASAPAQGARR